MAWMIWVRFAGGGQAPLGVLCNIDDIGHRIIDRIGPAGGMLQQVADRDLIDTGCVPAAGEQREVALQQTEYPRIEREDLLSEQLQHGHGRDRFADAGDAEGVARGHLRVRVAGIQQAVSALDDPVAIARYSKRKPWDGIGVH
jgi:hypothetical protein